jgi:hypothetical protein
MPVFCALYCNITQHIYEVPTGGKRTDVHRHYQTPKTFTAEMSDVLNNSRGHENSYLIKVIT